jgi:hypothetical protein
LSTPCRPPTGIGAEEGSSGGPVAGTMDVIATEGVVADTDVLFGGTATHTVRPAPVVPAPARAALAIPVAVHADVATAGVTSSGLSEPEHRGKCTQTAAPHADQQPAPRGGCSGQGAGEGIEAIGVHIWHPFRPQAAVGARRLMVARPPTSVVVLLGCSIHPTDGPAAARASDNPNRTAAIAASGAGREAVETPWRGCGPCAPLPSRR